MGMVVFLLTIWLGMFVTYSKYRPETEALISGTWKDISKYCSHVHVVDARQRQHARNPTRSRGNCKLLLLFASSANRYYGIQNGFQICPTSIVSNWAKEINKWLGERLEGVVLAVTCPKREEVIDRISQFCSQVRTTTWHFLHNNCFQEAIEFNFSNFVF